jgi:hypothetical protein
MAMWHMCIACWTSKATNTYTQVVQYPLLYVTLRYVIRKLPALSFLRSISVWHSYCISKHSEYIIVYHVIFFLWRCNSTLSIASSFLRFLDHTQRRTTVGRTTMDESLAGRRGLYLTTLNLLKTKRNMLYIWNQPVPLCKRFPPRL